MIKLLSAVAPNSVFSSLALLSVSLTVQGQTKPNYVIILADDMGYGDLSCHGGKTPTPNIDKLFNQSVEFENFMTCPLSSPTRAGLLTGLNPLRIGQAPYTGGQMATDIPNMATILKTVGCKTGVFGKWHNGNVPEFYPELPHVNDYGFDQFIGFYGGGLDYFTKIWQNKPTSPNWYNNKTEINNNLEYAPDLIARSAIEFMEANKTNLFLTYIPFNTVHAPLHVKESDLQRVPSSIVQAAGGSLRTWKEYYKLYNDGDAPAMNTMYAQLTGDNSILDITGTLTTAELQILYSAMLINLDDKVGELMKYLDDNNLTNNTVVLFFSDNGSTDRGSSLPFSGKKGSTLEGGVHSPACMRWPAANLVGPRKFKPMVGHLDVLPTFMEASGLTESAFGKLDGTSFLNEMKTKAIASNREYYWLNGDRDVIRTDKWKLNRLLGSYELFAIDTDIAESNNVYAQNPVVAADLLAKMEYWRADLKIALSHVAPQIEEPLIAAPQGAVLKLTASRTTDELIIDCAKISHRVHPGDYFYFDIKAEVGSKTDGLCLIPYTGTTRFFTLTKGVDQFGRIQINCPAPIEGSGKWERRVVGLGNDGTNTITKFAVSVRRPGTYTFYFDNLHIKQVDGTIVNVWNSSTKVSATNPNYTITSTDAYTLSAYFDANTAVDDVFDKKQLKIRQEPTQIVVSTDGQPIGSCSIYSLDSKLISKSGNNQESTCIIPIKRIRSGMYILLVEINKRFYNQKIAIF